MSWVYLDDHFDEHTKVEAAGGDAAWLYVCGLLYVNRNSTGGLIPSGRVARLSDRRNPEKLARKLVEVGLWEVVAEGYRIHDYEDHNRTAIERSEKARKASKARWKRSDDPPDSDAPSNAQADAEHAPSIAKPDAQLHAPSNAQADAEQSPWARARPALSPNPILTSVEQPPTVDGACSEEEDSSQNDVENLVREACELVAQNRYRRRSADREPVADVEKWHAATALKARTHLGDDMRKLVAERPGITPAELAAALDRKTLPGQSGTGKPAPSSTLDDTQAAQRVRTAEGNAAHAEAHSESGDPDAAKEQIRKMRDELRAENERIADKPQEPVVDLMAALEESLNTRTKRGTA